MTTGPITPRDLVKSTRSDVGQRRKTVSQLLRHADQMPKETRVYLAGQEDALRAFEDDLQTLIQNESMGGQGEGE